MTTPPTIDDADRAPEDRDDLGDWSAWEKTFRDARPVLPEAAMQRIEQAIKLQVQRAAPAGPHPRRWLLFLALGLIGSATVAWMIAGHSNTRLMPGVAPTIEDRLPLTYPTGPRRVGPTTSALPLAEERQVMIVAAGKSVDQGVATYRGPVSISIGVTRITCEALTVFRGPDSQGRLLSGKGSVHGENIETVGNASADEFTFNTATGLLVLTGNVHASIDRKSTIVSSLTITSQGTVQTTKE